MSKFKDYSQILFELFSSELPFVKNVINCDNLYLQNLLNEKFENLYNQTFPNLNYKESIIFINFPHK